MQKSWALMEVLGHRLHPGKGRDVLSWSDLFWVLPWAWFQGQVTQH